MNSIDIYIVVEGQTEQTFVRDVLAPELAREGIYLYAALIGKPGQKGGGINFERAKNDIGNFLKQRNDIYVSTMFDYCEIDNKWPGKIEVLRRMKDGVSLTAIQKAEILEAAMTDEIEKAFAGFNAGSRFIPYIEMHEFEALLFSNAEILARTIEMEVSPIREILEQYDSPEEINDDPIKSPSKRLEALKNGYRKVAYGKAVTEAIGIQTIRKGCAHFDGWLTKLAQLQEGT